MFERMAAGVSVAALLVALTVVFGSPTPRAAAADGATVEMRDDVFEPSVLRVSAGDRVTWVNHGRNPHTVVASDGVYASAVLQTGQSFSVTFAKEGRYRYFCSLHGTAHSGMVGTILVGAETPDEPATSATRSYPDTPPVRPAGGRVLRVPAQHPSIQAAVDAARPGDTILVAGGVYHEAVKVTTPHLTIRGEDRDRVILDGAFDSSRMNGIAVFGADGVVIENMTAHGYQLNGFYWRSVWGYRGSYLTAYNNGDYGIYAKDSGVGQFDHSYASGHPDSGFYIGQCDPCNAVITDVIAERNGLGYSGTNASGNLVIRDSVFRDNLAGIVPNTLDSSLLRPQHDALIVNNLVTANGSWSVPANAIAYPLRGIGIVVVGGNRNIIAYNRVEDHPTIGIALTPIVDEQLWIGAGNQVRDNVVTRSGLVDLAMLAPAAGGNCFQDNGGTSLPVGVEFLYGCRSLLAGLGGGDVVLAAAGLGFAARSLLAPPDDRWMRQPAPPSQPSMPDVNVVPAPAGPSTPVNVEAELARAASLARAPASALPSPGSVLLGAHGWLPFIAVLGFVVARAPRWRARGLPRALFVVGVPIAVYVAGLLVVFLLALLS